MPEQCLDNVAATNRCDAFDERFVTTPLLWLDDTTTGVLGLRRGCNDWSRL